MEEITETTIRRVAKLARIKVSDEDVINLVKDLSAILHEIENLQEVDTKNVEPISNVTQRKFSYREDKVTDGNCIEDVLSNAKESKFNCYVVPKVVE